MNTTHAQPVLAVSHLAFSYEGGEHVIRDLSFEIKKGEYVGLIGQNGSGKSTLLKLILGLLKPDGGMIKLFDTPLRQFAHWEKVGYVPQHSTIFDQFFPATVEEIVSLGVISGRRSHTWLTREEKSTVADALETVKLSSLRHRHLRELSGGQQQRVLIARALAGQPELILLDEPVVGVDTERQKEFYDLLKEMHQAKRLTLILVSHDLEIVAHQADYLLMLNEGELCTDMQEMIHHHKKHWITL